MTLQTPRKLIPQTTFLITVDRFSPLTYLGKRFSWSLVLVTLDSEIAVESLVVFVFP